MSKVKRECPQSFPWIILRVLSLLLSPAALAGPAPQFAFSINSSQIPGGIFPGSLGADAAGNVYVSSLSTVVKLAPNGAALIRWGTQGTGPGQFSYPGPIAFDHQTNVYVVDSNNNHIEKFDKNGNFLAAWGSSGTAHGQFDYPDGIALDSSDHVYVADMFNNRIQVFTSGGAFLGQFGSAGTNAGEFGNPGVITIDSSNNLYVIDVPATGYNNFRVQKFGLDGTFLAQWPAYGTNAQTFIEVAGIASDPSNDVYVVDSANNLIQKFSSNGTFLTEWGSGGTGPGQFNNPMGIAIDPSGNYIYVADFYNARINVFAFSALAPIIYQSPTNQTVPAGTTLTLNAAAFGAQPLAYHWQFNGADVPGATNAILIISNAPLAASGIYGLSVTNPLGIALGSNAIVIVLPVVISTLPASSISATGAVLEGNAVLGANASTVWFEWGSDTNYGTISGLTTLSANTSITVSQSLTNLSSAFIYHYRLNGSNSLGVVHGQDAQFQIGLSPSLVNLPIKGIDADSVFLNASVNPEARETSSFFRWGSTLVYGHNTPLNDIGNGITAVPVQSQITGLQAGSIYHAQAIASNELGVVYGADFTFITPPWYLLPAPTPVWTSITTSADGGVLAAVVNGDRAYVSTNSGLTWLTNNSPSTSWQAIAISADGSRLVAAAYGGPQGQTGSAYFSTNYGTTWTRSTGPDRNWVALASSADGIRLLGADASGGQILTSTNSGRNWITNSPPVSAPWSCVASSADGQRLMVAARGLNNCTNGPLFTPANAGHSWTSNNLPNQYWRSLASSADGQTLFAAVGGQHAGPIYTSTNAGITWNPTGAPVTNWQSIACSADAVRLVAVLAERRVIFTSTNSGLSWQTQVFPSGPWSAVASSADGARLFASGDRNIFTLQTLPAPRVETAITESQLLLSWLVPSAPFTLQGTTNLFPPDWSGVAISPTLNFTNLHYQVVVPATGAAAFYRLSSP